MTSLRSPGRIDLILAVLLGLLVLVVHDVSYLLRTPYWLDETWVVVTTKIPVLHGSRTTVATTPYGWAMLLRLVPFGGEQRQRLVPLAFSGASVIAAYFFGRHLRWPTVALARTAGLLAAAGALLAPSALIRNDLKQYTADAFIAVLLLVLLAAAERDWTRRRAAVLAAVAGFGFLFSSADAVLAPAAFLVLILALVARARWRAAAESVVAGALAAAVLGVIYKLFFARGNNPGLKQYWNGYYLPLSSRTASTSHWLDVRGRIWIAGLGLGPALLSIALVVLGILALVVRRQYAAAAFAPVVLVLMVALSAMKIYPLFDVRTSNFLAVLCVVTASAGIAWLCSLAARADWRAGLIVAAVALALFYCSVSSNIRAHTVPYENIRTAVNYVQSHRGPQDMVVLTMAANWGYAYYSNEHSFRLVSDPVNLQGYVLLPRNDPRLLVSPSPTGLSVYQSLERARAIGGAGVRIYFAYLHPRPAEVTTAIDWGHRYGYHEATSTGLIVMSPADS